MDIISNAITIVQTVQLVAAVLQDEKNLLNSARLLIHSCRLYEDALSTLQSTLAEKFETTVALISTAGSCEESLKDISVERTRVEEQVQLDTDLLKEILETVESIRDSKANRGFLVNVLKSITSGRVDKVQECSIQLNSRFQIISTLMIKDLWKVCPLWQDIDRLTVF